MTRLSPEALFRLSRVYAQGWNAARDASLRRGSAAGKAPTNPHKSEPARGRWNEGYAAAMENKNAGPKFKPRPASLGPAAKSE
jgi:hypothetical protein